MSEKSYFFNGASHGDAQLAPYTAEVFSKLTSLLHVTSTPVVFDEYPTADGFAVAPNAGMVLDIAAGKAFVGGVFISLAASQLTVPANISGLDRIDRVVLRVSYDDTSPAELVIKNGMPAVVPSFPSLSQVLGDVYEMSLARIYVPNGLAAITASHIIDEREILSLSSNAYQYANENVLPNSEFMASAGTGGSSPGITYSPAYWNLTSCECYVDDKFDSMVRGTTVRVECTSGSIQGMTTRMIITNQDTVPVTIRLLIEVIEGYAMLDTIPVVADTQGLIIPPTDGPVEVIIRTEFDAADPELDLFVGNYDSGACIFKLGQVTAAYGNTGASFGAVKELIIFGNPVTQTGLTLSDSIAGPGVVDVSYSINEDEIARGATAALVKMEFRDSGSSGGACTAYLQTIWGLDITSATNSALFSNHSFIFLKQDAPLDTDDPPKVDASVQARTSANLGISYIGLQT